MCKTKIVIKPVTFSIFSAAQSMISSWSWSLIHQVITKDPVMPPSAPHHLPTPHPIGGKGLMGGAPMSRLVKAKFQSAPPKLMFKRARLTLTDTSRPAAPPGAWAPPPTAYSGYGAQQQQVIDDRHDIAEVVLISL